MAHAERIDVLVAEDNEINQQVIAMTLDLDGLSYLIVGNGKEAVEAWQLHDPSVILMDVSMPVMDGLEAASAIRGMEAETGNRVPIVACTAHALRGDDRRCLDAGMDDYVAKPLTPDRILAVIQKWLPETDHAVQSA